MNIIEIKNLHKIYESGVAETRALAGLNLEIKKSEFAAIMGPSGSGKSTLLHVLGFLDRPTSGEYIFNGKSLNSYTDEEIARTRNEKMGFVFQAFNLLRRTSVLDNVKLPLLYSGVPEEKWEDMARSAIDKVGLSHRLHHEPSQLSGGEQQRVAIARALVLNPEVIFADEPTGNLDSKSGQMIMEILQHLHEQEGRTIVLITHETFTAEHSQRIFHLLDGKIDRTEELSARRRAKDNFIK